MGAEIDRLEVQIETSAKEANSQLDKLVNNLEKLENSLTAINKSNKFTGLATGVKAINSSYNSLNLSGNRLFNATNNLTSSFTRMYVRLNVLKKGFSALQDAFSSTSDYIEAYNYFDVTLGKIGSEWAHQWEDYADKIGVSSAEEYANSFQTRLSQSLSKLSGVQIDIGADGSGLLTETGMKNLGLNIQEVTQYASQLASVTNSVGQTGEVSLAAASAFTKLGADMSSLFNVDYSAVMGNLQSGLIGQSRALYKYGIDITNATLQTYAYELGLSKAVSEMTQAEKMQLRMLAILDQSKVSWGDLANTINSPSNMIRQFGNNMKEAGMVLGQLFIPALQKVLPVANGLAIAFKQLFVSIASLLGIKLNLDSYSQGYTDLEEDIEGVSNGFEEASNAAKKLKGQLQGFDELNVIKSQDSSGAGAAGGVIDLTKEILEATAEYEKAWAEAYEKMQNKAQKFADKIVAFFKPFADIFREDLGNIEWNALAENLGNFADAVAPYAENFGEGFLNFFEDLGDISVDVINALFGENGAIIGVTDWLNENDPEKAEKWGYACGLLVTGLMAFSGLSKVVTTITTLLGPLKSLVGLIGKTGVFASMGTALSSLGGLGGLFTMDLATILGAGTAMEIGLTIGTGIIAGITVAWAGFNGGKWIGEKLFPEDAEWYKNFAWTGEDGFFKTVSKDWKSTFDGLIAMANDFENNPVIATLTRTIGGPFIGIPANIALAQDAFTEFKDKWGDDISDWWNNYVEPWLSKEKWITLGENLKDGIFDGFKGISNNVIGILNNVIASLEKMLNTAIGGINEMLSGLNDSALAEFFDFKIEVAEVTFGRIPTFSVGDFPEDGLFFANHSELVGKFSNGKTAVANNEQIIEGIKYGVREAVSEVLAPYLADIAQNTRETADKEFGITEDDVVSAVVNQNRIFRNRTGITILES